MWSKNCTILYYTLCFLSLGCNSNKIDVTAFNTIKKVDSISTLQFADFDGIGKYYQPFKSKNVYFLGTLKNNIYKLNLTTLKLQEYVLPKYINGAEDFTVNENLNLAVVVANDTIYEYHLKTFAINKRPVIRTQDGYLWNTHDEFPIFLCNNKNYLMYYLPDGKGYKDKRLYIEPFLCQLEPDNMVIMENTYYPFGYKQKCYGLNFCPRRLQVDENKHAFVFDQHDSIFVYDLNTKQKEKHFFGSKKNIPFVGIPFDSIQFYNQSVFDELLLKSTAYIYSKYLSNIELYYRLILFRSTNKSKKIHVVFYDKNFNYLNEMEVKINSLIYVDVNNKLYCLNYKNKHIICSELDIKI